MNRRCSAACPLQSNGYCLFVDDGVISSTTCMIMRTQRKIDKEKTEYCSTKNVLLDVFRVNRGEFLTTKDLARLAGVSREVVYACLKRILMYHPETLEVREGGYHNKGYRLKEED